MSRIVFDDSSSKIKRESNVIWLKATMPSNIASGTGNKLRSSSFSFRLVLGKLLVAAFGFSASFSGSSSSASDNVLIPRNCLAAASFSLTMFCDKDEEAGVEILAMPGTTVRRFSTSSYAKRYCSTASSTCVSSTPPSNSFDLMRRKFCRASVRISTERTIEDTRHCNPANMNTTTKNETKAGAFKTGSNSLAGGGAVAAAEMALLQIGKEEPNQEGRAEVRRHQLNLVTY